MKHIITLIFIIFLTSGIRSQETAIIFAMPYKGQPLEITPGESVTTKRSIHLMNTDSMRTEIIRNPKGAEKVTYKYDSQGNQTMAIIERIDVDPEAIRLKIEQLVQEHEYASKLIEQYQEEIRKLRKQQRETQQEAQDLGKLLRNDKSPKQ